MTLLLLLFAWYRRHGRDLPWRTTRNAYRIFISELMLQQTQVDRVIPKYRAWLRRFPSWKKLASASTRELMIAWAGLGYNRRALYARDAARTVIRDGIPTTAREWQRLKGAGPYMAAALAEFVNHERAIVIDTNIRRVAGRVLLGMPYPHRSDDPRIRTALNRVVPERDAHWQIPHALMDLGASICTPRIPRCDICPLAGVCRARRRFVPEKRGATLRLLAKHHERTRVHERRHAEKKFPDRIYRGRILSIVRTNGRTRIAMLGPNIDETFDPVADRDWIRSMVKRLVKDGLLLLHPGDTISF